MNQSKHVMLLIAIVLTLAAVGATTYAYIAYVTNSDEVVIMVTDDEVANFTDAYQAKYTQTVERLQAASPALSETERRAVIERLEADLLSDTQE